MVRIFTALALCAFVFASAPAAGEGVTELFTAGTVRPADVTPLIAEKDGALEINNAWPTTVRLANVDLKDKKIDQSVVAFTADMQAVNFTGKAYLEMWLHFPGKGFYFSRGLDNQLTEDSGWRTYGTTFVLKKNEQPDNVVLNLRFDGAGTVRVKNIRVLSNTGTPVQEAEKPAEKAEDKAENKAEDKGGE